MLSLLGSSLVLVRRGCYSAAVESKIFFPVTRIFCDSNGQSQFSRFRVPMSGSGAIGYLSQLVGASGVQFRFTPPDYNYSWHNAPCRQFIVNLDADVTVRVSSGEERLIQRGEVFFVEDLTGEGHYSTAVERQPRHSLFIPVPDDFRVEDFPQDNS